MINTENKNNLKPKKAFTQILLLILLILIILFFISGILAGHKNANYTICLKNLEKIGNAVEKYKIDNKCYPKYLEILVKAKYIDNVPFCPENNKSYIFKVQEKNNNKYFEIYCPNPNKHKRKGNTFFLIKYSEGKGVESKLQ